MDFEDNAIIANRGLNVKEKMVPPARGHRKKTTRSGWASDFCEGVSGSLCALRLVWTSRWVRTRCGNNAG